MPGKGIWRTKSAEQSIADSLAPDTRLRRELTAWDLTVLGVAVVIGAGIFTLTARTVGDVTGPSASLAFVIAAIACGLAAMCYAEFASTVPVAGSAYTFSYATFGEFLAWVIGWDLILEFAVGAAAVAKAWSAYLHTVLGYVTGEAVPTTVRFLGLTVDWGALVLVTAMAVLLVLGTKLSSRVSMVVTAIKVGIVLFVILLGLFFVKLANYTPFIPPTSDGAAGGETGVHQSLFSVITGGASSTFGLYGLLAGASLLFFAFIGFDMVATTAEETRNPQRAVPRGILGSLAIVTVLYVGVSLVITGMVNYRQLATTTAADGTPERKTLATAFADNGVDWAANVISIGALAGLTTAVMIAILGQVRILFAMSRDGLLPRALARTGPRGTPVRATLLVATMIGGAATFFSADRLEEMVSVGTLFAFILVSAGVIVLRRTRPDLRRGFRMPGVPALPILAILACLWLMLNLTVLTWLRFLAWMAAGVVVYFVYSRRHSVLARKSEPEPPTDTVPEAARTPVSERAHST
jgi:basic amino acid/polyamine antiporter, APA family